MDNEPSVGTAAKTEAEMKKGAEKLIDFISKSPSPYHAASNIAKTLESNGFTRLDEKKPWEIKSNGKYFFIRGGSSAMAFIAGKGNVSEKGFRIIAAHTDSPCFRIKPSPEIEVGGKYIKLNTAPYGGMVLSTWFDRPLSIAGRVFVKSDNIFEPVEILVDINKPILTIPNLAIHFNREANDGVKLNLQSDTLPFLGLVNAELEKNNILLNILSASCGAKISDIIDFDLCLYEYSGGIIMGNNDEFISSGRLDDLWMVHAGLEAFISSKFEEHTSVLFFPDNEETGSLSAQGAFSDYLKDSLCRFVAGMNLPVSSCYAALANTTVVSADLAHATHPNYSDKSDPTTKPYLGGGPVLKYSVAQKYSTTGKSAAVFRVLCDLAEVPMQKFIIRSDIAGGSTIGAMVAASLGCDVIDMGAPIFAMHSIRELGAVADDYYTKEVFKKFLS